MAESRNTEFVDIQGKGPLKVTEYLPEDLRKNWEQTWSCTAYNPERTFNESPLFFTAKKKLWYTGWVTLVGGVGEGKTCTAEHLVTSFVKGPWQLPQAKRAPLSSRDDSEARHNWQKKIFLANAIDEKGRPSYEPVWVTSPDEYLAKVDPRRPQIVVIDDLFGKACFSQSRLELWRPHLTDMLARISSNHPKTLVVVCVSRAHLDALPDDIAQMEWFNSNAVVDIKDGNSMPLDSGHKRLHDKANGLVSYLRDTCPTFRREGDNFLNNPWSYVEPAVDKVYRFDKILYYTMAVTVVLDGKLDLTKATLPEYDDHTQNVMKQLITILEVPEHVDLAKMRYAAQKLVGLFLQPDGELFRWRMTHQKVLQVCAKSLFSISTNRMLDRELMSQEFLLDHIRPYGYSRRQDDIVIPLVKKHFKELGQRYTYEIKSGFMKEVIKNPCFEDEEFVKVWFAGLKESNSLESVVFFMDAILKRSLFYWACYYGKGPVVKEILESKELTNKLSKEEMIWGLQAACASNTQISAVIVVRCLLSHGVTVTAREEYEGANAADVFGTEMVHFMFLAATPIHIAARRANLETVKALIEHGASITQTAKDGMTPLHRAASRCHGDSGKIVELLIEKGADWKVKSMSGRMALHEAFTSGCLDNIQALVDAGADLNDKMPDGRSFLSVAIENEQRRVVDYLLYKVDIKTHAAGDNFSPLHRAVQKGDSSLAERLIEKGADMETTSTIGWTALHMACYLANDKMATLLIHKGADVNHAANDWKTALHIAAMKGHFEMCDLLIENGAKTEAMCGNSDTPLVLAARGGHKMVVWLLLREGMELETTSKGWTNRKGTGKDYGPRKGKFV